MFEGFSQQKDTQARKRFAASTGAAIAVCAVLGVTMAALASGTPPPRKKEIIEVAFHGAPPPKPPPVAPPAPRPKPKKQAGTATQAKVNVAAATPVAVPDTELAEGSESDFASQGEIGDIANTAIGGLDGAADAKKPIEMVEKSPGERGPVVLPDKAEPPEPEASNRTPEYPEEMRKKGVEALVVLRVVIDERGAVRDIKVESGDEPFLSVAIATVKQWRYSPAMLDGKAISTYRMIRVPFRLNR